MQEVISYGQDYVLTEDFKELGGHYNPSQILDDLVRLQVKALGFEVNRNGFQFQRGPLEAVHQTKFGEQIPAYKTFEGKQVNRNHRAIDNGSPANEPIGYVERSILKDDGVYLDLVLWKRCLSDNELSQLRNGRAHVSMEVEYTDPQTKNGVRTMSSTSIVSFVGIAVLFNGIQPGDQNSGILAVENAKLHSHDGNTERTTSIEEISSDNTSLCKGDEMETPALTPELEQLQTELAEVKARAEQLEAEKAELAAQKEAAEVTQQELQAAVAERDKKLDELIAKESEYMALQSQINALRENAFNENLGKCFSMDQLGDEQKSMVRSLFSNCYGNAEPAPYMELAANLVLIADAATEAVRTYSKHEDSEADDAAGETSAAGEQSAAGETPVPAAEPAPAPAPADEPPAPAAPSIAGSKPAEPTVTFAHMSSR